MDRAQLYKLTELIVAEVVRRIAQEERRRQHPEQVLVLLADSVSFPEKLQQTLNEQFGVAYTPVSIPETNTFADEALLYAGKLEPGGLLERVKEAKTVILVSPRLELLRRIASGDDHYDFPLTCADGVNGDEEAALFLPGLNVDGLDELKLQPIQLFGLDRADDGSLHSS